MSVKIYQRESALRGGVGYWVDKCLLKIMTLELGHDREKGLHQTEEVAVAGKVSEPPKICSPP